MKGFIWLVGFWLGGELLVRVSGLPIPGAVVGMVLLLAALHLGWVQLVWIKETAEFLLSHMLAMFAPVIAGVVIFYPVLQRHWLPVAGALALGTLVVFAVSGLTAVWMGQGRRRKKQLQSPSQQERTAVSDAEF
ncbi:CidA/LrgA family protein [Paenibacillus sp. GCM10027626]|uniref:CidA/LrgA family protein n=1 Tax=Paenibacillus sp. GCM10027626 TaxID=3273411 RepID=UPI003624F210